MNANTMELNPEQLEQITGADVMGISKMNIRGEMNLLFTMSKLIVSILDAAEDTII